MAIARLKQVTLVGPILRQNTVIQSLQALGCLHIVPAKKAVPSEQQEDSEKAADALKYLKSSPRFRRQRRPNGDPLPNIIDAVLQNKAQRADKIDEIEVINQHLLALKPWGSFRFASLEQMGGYQLWFYQVPLNQFERLSFCPQPWKSVAKDHKQHYVVMLSKQEPASDQVPFQRVHTGSRCWAELCDQLELAETALEELNAQRESLTAWIGLIQRWINDYRDCEDREWVGRQALLDDITHCFVLRAWVPKKSLDALKIVVSEQRLAMQLTSPAAADTPPVLLDNPEVLAGAEDVVGFFQLPGYRSWDPTPVVFFSFAFFFAMILSDAGYAALLSVYLVFRWRKWSATKAGKRIRGLLVSVLLAAVIYGVLVGSYFGITPGSESFLGHLHVLDMQNFDAMMLLSLVVGVCHLLLANALKAITLPKGFMRWAPWGWNLVIGGGFVFWLALAYPTLIGAIKLTALYSMASGALIVLLCSGQRLLHSWKDVPFRLLDGLKALYGLSKAFGDVLSYLRLFALGLASASLAITFNQLAIDARDSVEHGGFILFTLVLLAGHGLNLVLGIMSGVIHGLRLNLLEFYNWGVEGEGTPFKPFRKRGE
jgi:V/A-type H+-transporting ATPase subunit I